MKPYSNDLKRMVIEEIQKGKSNGAIYPIARSHGYQGNFKTFREYTRGLRRELKIQKVPEKKPTKEDRPDIFLQILKEKGSLKLLDICNMFRCPPNEIHLLIEKHRKNGYEITTDDHRVFLSTDVAGEHERLNKKLGSTEITFGVASDLHFGSKACQITALNEFAEICKKKDVKYIFCPGDIFAGYNVYPGQLHDLYAVSADEQLSSVICNLPQGFKWFMMGGNHDYNFISKGGGYNILNVLSNKRKDTKYIGYDDVVIPILNGVDLKMIHPSGGVPYAISYRLQKSIEQIAYSELSTIAYGSKDKPTIRFVLSGHLHIQMQAMFGSILGLQAGCFEGQTNYLKRKGLFPTIGGWIIRASLGRTGLLRNFEAKFYVFEEIEDDWENYNHTLPKENEESCPVFEQKNGE